MTATGRARGYARGLGSDLRYSFVILPAHMGRGEVAYLKRRMMCCICRRMNTTTELQNINLIGSSSCSVSFRTFRMPQITSPITAPRIIAVNKSINSRRTNRKPPDVSYGIGVGLKLGSYMQFSPNS